MILCSISGHKKRSHTLSRLMSGAAVVDVKSFADGFPPPAGDIVDHASPRSLSEDVLLTTLVRDRYGHNCLYENNDWL